MVDFESGEGLYSMSEYTTEGGGDADEDERAGLRRLQVEIWGGE